MFAGSKVFSELGNLILFLLLEGISFYLIITYNDSQAKIYHNSVNVISGTMADKASNIRGYFSLKEQNTNTNLDKTFKKTKSDHPSLDCNKYNTNEFLSKKRKNDSYLNSYDN